MDKVRYKQITDCLKVRVAWYERAIAMHKGEIEWDNHFDWPSCSTHPRDPMSLCEWRGALRELENTLDMMK